MCRDPETPRRRCWTKRSARTWRGPSRFGDREAMIECQTGRGWSYGEFHRGTRRIATALLARGIGPGDRVGIWSPNTAEWTMIQYATAEIGAILVTINPAYHSRRTGVRAEPVVVCMVLAARSFKTSDYVDDARRGARPLPPLHESSSSDHRHGRDRADRGRRRRPRRRGRRRAPGDPINIQYTSGTTGFPKGATLTHPTSSTTATSSARACELHRGGPGLHPGAVLSLLRHGAGQSGVHGARRRDGDAGGGIRPARRRSKQLRRERCTSLYGVPTMFIAELELPNFDEST